MSADKINRPTPICHAKLGRFYQLILLSNTQNMFCSDRKKSANFL